MPVSVRVFVVLLSSLVGAAVASGQQAAPSNRISLDVVVTDKSNKPVAGLKQEDFTVLDNKGARPIATFAAVRGQDVPTEVVLLIDAVNADYETVARARQEIDTFLRVDGGHLTHPTSIAIFADTSMQISGGFTSDGNELSASLDQMVTGLRAIGRSSGLYGAQDQLQLSLDALSELMTKEASLPGRKIVLWVSPGWPLLSGPEVTLSEKQEQSILAQIEHLSTTMRRANIILYSINPLGTDEDLESANRYRAFLKGVSKPAQVELGDLGLQVLAVQSGGLALSADNDISHLLARSIADTQNYYRLSFDPPAAEHTGEYHQLEIKVSRPGLTARTRTGYYTQP